MESKHKTKGTWGVRFFIFVLSVALGVLMYWLLSFIEQDIGNLKGPDRQQVREKYVEASLDTHKKILDKDINHLSTNIQTLDEQLGNLKKSTDGLQNTINQLLAIQRQSIEKGISFPQKSDQTLNETQSTFLDNQNKDQLLNKQISELTLQRQAKQQELTELTDKIKLLESGFFREYNRLLDKHRWKVAAIKLTFLLPVFLVFSVVFMKYRTSSYCPLVWAAFISSFIKIAVVVHKYFPQPYFKYITILLVIAIVLRLLFYMIKMVIAPKKDLLIKQCQQSYDKCLCPVCSKPIRTGPLQYVGGLSKKTLLQVSSSADISDQQPYSCPSCGSKLYHKCQSCGNVRHSLLPYCQHCGSEYKKTIESTQDTD